MPTWDQFAWAAFLFGAIDGDKVYQALMQKTSFLKMLRSAPLSLSASDIQENLIKGFLNKWKTRVKNCQDSANALRQNMSTMSSYLRALMPISIESINFQQHVRINSRLMTVGIAVERCYEILRGTGHRIGPTATAKILHILQPRVFVMWDGAILDCFRRRNIGITDSGQGYRCFLEEMRKTAHQVIQNFNNRSLSPPAAPGQSPSDYLSKRLSYDPQKTIAKFLDEYYWLKVTSGVMVPPSWHP